MDGACAAGGDAASGKDLIAPALRQCVDGSVYVSRLSLSGEADRASGSGARGERCGEARRCALGRARGPALDSLSTPRGTCRLPRAGAAESETRRAPRNPQPRHM